MTAITAKGQGKNFHPPYTLNDMAADVIALMNELNLVKAHIAGISMGGMISQIIALEYPKRVLSLTCIASTSGDADLPPASPEVLEFFFSTPKLAQDVESYVNNMMRIYRIYHHPDYFCEHSARELYTKAYQRAYRPEGSKRQLLAVMFARPRGNNLKQIQLPSLVIHGDYDPVFPIEHGKYLAQCLSGSHFEVIEKMGHGLPEFVHRKLIASIAKLL